MMRVVVIAEGGGGGVGGGGWGFFFQAEDGIRDWSVTGVQTCALPISSLNREPLEPSAPKKKTIGTTHF